MSIVLLPFATELMAAYLRAAHGQKLAAAVYSGAFLLMSLVFSALNRHILLNRAHMLRVEMPLDERRAVLSRALSAWSPIWSPRSLAVVSPMRRWPSAPPSPCSTRCPSPAEESPAG